MQKKSINNLKASSQNDEDIESELASIEDLQLGLNDFIRKLEQSCYEKCDSISNYSESKSCFQECVAKNLYELE